MRAASCRISSATTPYSSVSTLVSPHLTVRLSTLEDPSDLSPNGTLTSALGQNSATPGDLRVGVPCWSLAHPNIIPLPRIGTLSSQLYSFLQAFHQRGTQSGPETSLIPLPLHLAEAPTAVNHRLVRSVARYCTNNHPDLLLEKASLLHNVCRPRRIRQPLPRQR